MDAIQEFFGQLGPGIGNLLIALLILIVGYIVARILGSVTRRLLKRTDLDNRLADWLSDPEEPRKFNVESVIGSVVFWLVMLFVLVAFFDRLNLTGIASPLSLFLQRLTTEFLPRLIGAGVLLIIAWLVATALRFLVRKGGAYVRLVESRIDWGRGVSCAEPGEFGPLPGVYCSAGISADLYCGRRGGIGFYAAAA